MRTMRVQSVDPEVMDGRLAIRELSVSAFQRAFVSKQKKNAESGTGAVYVIRSTLLEIASVRYLLNESMKTAWIGVRRGIVARRNAPIDTTASIAAPLIMLASSVSMLWKL
jgi:hypothetical protein